MILLDQYDPNILSLQNASSLLSDDEYIQFLGLTEVERKSVLKQLVEHPIGDFTIVHELYFRTKWAQLFYKFYKNEPFSLLEVASGDADMIPQCISHSNPNSTYITANMNQALNHNLIKKLEGVPIKYRLIDDDAMEIVKYLEDSSVDVIAFQHGLNDVLQAIVCGYYDVDTINSQWMEILPTMIELLTIEVNNGTLKEKVYEPLQNLLHTLSQVLKTNGIIAINHYMFQYDLDLGYPIDLFTNLIPIVRSWLNTNKDFKEINMDGFSKQWWLFLQKF